MKSIKEFVADYDPEIVSEVYCVTGPSFGVRKERGGLITNVLLYDPKTSEKVLDALGVKKIDKCDAVLNKFSIKCREHGACCKTKDGIGSIYEMSKNSMGKLTFRFYAQWLEPEHVDKIMTAIYGE